MSELSGLFDALYSRLLLRDFFGKVVPGAIVIFSVCATVFTPAEVAGFVQNMSFLPATIFVGLAWIVAFSVQALGEKTKLIRYHDLDTNRQFYVRRKEFLDKTTDAQEHQQLERLAVIKEACGNGYLALVLSSILFFVDFLVKYGVVVTVEGIKSHWYQLVFLVGLTIFLACMHFIHVGRQTEYMDTVLNRKRSIDGKRHLTSHSSRRRR